MLQYTEGRGDESHILEAARRIHNSIQMVGHANFSQKQMHGKSTGDIQDMLMLEKNINWNDFSVTCKREAAASGDRQMKSRHVQETVATKISEDG